MSVPRGAPRAALLQSAAAQDDAAKQLEEGGSLDFCAPDFDALRALRTPGLAPPVPNAPPLDNLSKARSLLPPELPESLANVAPVAPASEARLPPPPPLLRACRQPFDAGPALAVQPTGQSFSPLRAVSRYPHARSLPSRRRMPTKKQESRARREALKARAARTVDAITSRFAAVTLASLMDEAKPGPMSRLREWAAAGCRVRVVTRHAAGVRGAAEGTLVAYDKYMNLLLRDVREAYTVIVKVPRTKTALAPLPAGAAAAAAAAATAAADAGPSGITPADIGGGGGDDDAEGAFDFEARLPGAPADEAAAPSCSGGEPGVPPGFRRVTRTRWCRKQEHRQRTLNQVLLRGDNVVLISCVDAPPAAAAAAAAAGGTAPTSAAGAAAPAALRPP
jgi:small nuclear ribonucleoprotein (snRNP)-like protein